MTEENIFDHQRDEKKIFLIIQVTRSKHF